jgi:hypothetical protein
MNKKGISSPDVHRLVRTIHPTRGFLYGALILGALLAFEMFNYTTTDYALSDLMGNLRFMDIRWATILALAFCGIDFAGLARLFTPERGTSQPKEVWYLFGAWLLAATMNAMLTWWGVAIAILSHTSLGSSFIPSKTLISVVPIFVAIMVWVIRVLIIGSLSVAGNRIFSQAELAYQAPTATHPQPVPFRPIPASETSLHPAPTPDPVATSQAFSRPEPTYHPASMSGSNRTSHDVRK